MLIVLLLDAIIYAIIPQTWLPSIANTVLNAYLLVYYFRPCSGARKQLPEMSSLSVPSPVQVCSSTWFASRPVVELHAGMFCTQRSRVPKKFSGFQAQQRSINKGFVNDAKHSKSGGFGHCNVCSCEQFVSTHFRSQSNPGPTQGNRAFWGSSWAVEGYKLVNNRLQAIP